MSIKVWTIFLLMEALQCLSPWSSGSIRFLARLSERCVSIDLGELRDFGRKRSLLSIVCYERRGGVGRVPERIQCDYLDRCGLHHLARSSHIL